MKEFGGEEKHAEEVEEEENAMNQNAPLQGNLEDVKLKSETGMKRLGAGSGKLEGRLIVSEKRSTGSVSWKGMFDTRFAYGHDC
jgi:ATP-binding cassette, subfamily C (CFTR/MRP), member 1